MAHFAEIDVNNIVKRVLVVPDSEESRGQEFLANDLGFGGVWIQTSYNGKIRKTFAGIGYTYNAELDIFLPPKPYNSWVLNKLKGEWEAPAPRPTTQENEMAVWHEDTLAWTVEPNILPA